MVEPQTQDYTFVDDKGEEVVITGPVDATDEELQAALVQFTGGEAQQPLLLLPPTSLLSPSLVWF